MSKFAYHTTLRRLKNNNGVFNGAKRITNVTTGNSWYGYAEVNTQATSPFARTKVHDGKFVGDSDIRNGHLIKDNYDNSYYLVMSCKGILSGNLTAYWDATLYFVTATCTVQRFNTGARDSFSGEYTTNTPANIYTNVYTMINPMNYDTLDQPDVVVQANKIKAAVQSSYTILVNDRIITSRGTTYIVENVDEESLRGEDGTGLNILYLNSDVR